MSYEVYFGPVRVGRLEAHRSRLEFRYTQDVAEAGAPALSVHLPTRSEPFGHDASDAYFANLLPEDEYRRLVAKVVGQSDRNIAGLLGAIGGECAGAVSIWPAGEVPPAVPEYVPLDAEAVRRLLDGGNVQERLAVVREARLSLAGGMEKLGLRKQGGQWFRSRRGAPTTHILKWPPLGYEDLPYNELFCHALWQAVGIPVAEAEVLNTVTPVLVVRRFDRVEPPDGGLRLIHQEDFAQATGTHPASKYQADGGPGFAACAAVLREFAAVPARERELVMRWGIANFLTGNEDAHAKNLALLHEPQGTRLAPFYDIVCTQAYRGLRRAMAMSYGGEYRPAFIRTRHWERFAAELGLPMRLVRSEAIELADAFETSLPTVRADLERQYGPHPVFERVQRAVKTQIGRAVAQLAGKAMDPT
jgi:serine/threonine-protein kinase HipA